MGQILSTLLSEDKCRFIKENIPPKYLPETEHYYVYSYREFYPDYKKELVVDVKYNKYGYEKSYDDDPVPKELLDNITYIKTGSFKEELKSTVKPYVGSTNQEFRRVK